MVDRETAFLFIFIWFPKVKPQTKGGNAEKCLLSAFDVLNDALGFQLFPPIHLTDGFGFQLLAGFQTPTVNGQAHSSVGNERVLRKQVSEKLLSRKWISEECIWGNESFQYCTFLNFRLFVEHIFYFFSQEIFMLNDKKQNVRKWEPKEYLHGKIEAFVIFQFP